MDHFVAMPSASSGLARPRPQTVRSGRSARGELQSADSIHFAKELRFRTDHGRAVYGGGGITPDIAVAADSSSARVRVGGGLALVREALSKDPVFQRAAALLAKAHAPRDVFAALVPVKADANAPPSRRKH